MSEPRDSELNLRAIVGFAIGLTAVTVASAVGLWYFSKFLRDNEAAKDPARPALEAARAPHEPPGPRLQSDPVGELEALREKEDAILESYTWTDEWGREDTPIRSECCSSRSSLPRPSGESDARRL